MKKVLLVIALTCFLLPSVANSQDNTAEQKLITAGYLLYKESTKLKLLRSDLAEVMKKSKGLNELDIAEMCHITMLMENILLVETICMYEGILLGSMPNIEKGKIFEQYKVHHSQLKGDILNRLYVNYQGTQSCAANIDDKIILEFADKAKEEMQTTLRVIEEVIKILHSQIKTNS
jgi:hypothetical protein